MPNRDMGLRGDNYVGILQINHLNYNVPFFHNASQIITLCYIKTDKGSRVGHRGL